MRRGADTACVNDGGRKTCSITEVQQTHPLLFRRAPIARSVTQMSFDYLSFGHLCYQSVNWGTARVNLSRAEPRQFLPCTSHVCTRDQTEIYVDQLLHEWIVSYFEQNLHIRCSDQLNSQSGYDLTQMCSRGLDLKAVSNKP